MHLSSALTLLAASLSMVSLLPSASSHATLHDPKPRITYAEGSYPPKIPFPANIESCDVAAAPDPGPGPIAATYYAGQTILIHWDTSIPHVSSPGISMYMKYDDNDKFANNVLATALTAGPGGMNGVYITLPQNKSGAKAVFRWQWESTQDGGYYVSCADIAVLPYDPSKVTAPTAIVAARVNKVFRVKDASNTIVDQSLTAEPQDFTDTPVASTPTPTPTPTPSPAPISTPTTPTTPTFNFQLGGTLDLTHGLPASMQTQQAQQFNPMMALLQKQLSAATSPNALAPVLIAIGSICIAMLWL